MKKEKRLKHALHNEKLCRLIQSQNDYADWVITTGFYAALHFVSYKIFPLHEQTSDGVKFEIKSLDEYHNFKRPTYGKHEALADLVFAVIPKISPEYDWLKDICMTARYQNYQQSAEDANRALKLLETIKNELNISEAE